MSILIKRQKRISKHLTIISTLPFAIILIQGCGSSVFKGDTDGYLKNVIVIVSDDHTTKALGCYGNRIIHTPNLDRLASEGIRFTNAYANAPLCSASRQSLLTGKYPHATGVTLLTTPFRDEGKVTIAEILREKGLKTGIVGKTHFNNYMDSIPPSIFRLDTRGSINRKIYHCRKAALKIINGYRRFSRTFQRKIKGGSLPPIIPLLNTWIQMSVWSSMH